MSDDATLIVGILAYSFACGAIGWSFGNNKREELSKKLRESEITASLAEKSILEEAGSIITDLKQKLKEAKSLAYKTYSYQKDRYIKEEILKRELQESTLSNNVQNNHQTRDINKLKSDLNQARLETSDLRDKLLETSDLKDKLKEANNVVEDWRERYQSSVISVSRRNSELVEAYDEIKTQNILLQDIYSNAIEKIMKDGALLPSLIEWADFFQKTIDERKVNYLQTKKHPAFKAAEDIKEVRAAARELRQEVNILKNRVALYEAQAPWLVEYEDFSVEDVVEGLRQEKEIKKLTANGDDPIRVFVSAAEWKEMSATERNQLALERYWNYRQRNAWAAGIQYERYVGYNYEQDGYDVIYHGAVKGLNDLGIDLVCSKNGQTQVIQCKRLSSNKGRPVRENTVAQIFGASLYYAHIKNIDMDSITPIIMTTFELSPEAKQFASVLGVEFTENDQIKQYPCIKCNISGKDGARIYHLPFDQQYDTTKIEQHRGECYKLTVAEAEAEGFRRAFRWTGATNA
ncbi:restriction endonuclease [Solemya velum gill symbiont]|uniref:restriction endonuclease n=1 Tax=Solemya velum gill symbiont TaxID=2340 RepID=UPI00099893C5|nr:restriction endonuclease [Solemya velum gill symbiont]OOY67276.1 hypothetical protein BOW06_07225 [Solemya velum gill symbiont]OOY94991.1 hypothetical protein BOW18_11125 [Solemya velum gill symbiont]